MQYLLQAGLISLQVCLGIPDAKPVLTPITNQYIYCQMGWASYQKATSKIKEKFVLTTGKP